MAKLEIQGLCKGFDKPVIDGLDLTVDEGEFFVVVGPSGIGKTTLLRCIAGLEVPDAGTVAVAGREVTRMPPYRRAVAMTFESYALYPHLTVFENIASPLRARRADRATVERRVTDVARMLGIDALLERRPGEISGGQKQRTALGRTLVAEPDIFLLDEPISHLDAKIRHELRQEFHHLQALRRVATIFVTHDYTEALSLGDRIGVMGAGKLVQVGTPRDVFRKPRTLFVAQHLGDPTINVLPGRIARRDDGLYAECAGTGFAFPVAERHAERLNGAATGGVTVGIRPQHLAVIAAAGGAGGRVTRAARVEIFEPLGSVGVLIAETDGASLTVLTRPDDDFRPGDPVNLALDTASFHYFDAVDGANLLI